MIVAASVVAELGAFAGAVAAVVVGYFGYRAANQGDRRAKRADAVGGFDTLVGRLQEDNRTLRGEYRICRKNVARLDGLINDLRNEVRALSGLTEANTGLRERVDQMIVINRRLAEEIRDLRGTNRILLDKLRG